MTDASASLHLSSAAMRLLAAAHSPALGESPGEPPPRARWVAVSSARPGEGKSFVAAGLALSAARLGARVLLIDAHLERPRVHELFGCSPEGGLAQAVEAGARAELWPQPGPHSGLALLPAGEAAGRGLPLNRNWVSWLRGCVHGEFDLVLLDCAPLGGSGGALCAQADGGLVVVDASATRHEVVTGAIAACGIDRRRLLGIVLNRRPLYIPQFLYRCL